MGDVLIYVVIEEVTNCVSVHELHGCQTLAERVWAKAQNERS